ncbi:nucleotide cyclase [Baffinella frigidus]|nr:nucleotide cyclase [Cryptophyta sp. CCMP2293]
MQGRRVEPEHHDLVTIFFSDIVGYPPNLLTPKLMMEMLERLYHAIDSLALHFNVFKVETIGDAYMAVTNLAADHVQRIAQFAIAVIAAADKIPIDELDLACGTVKLRVGFHTGPVVANVNTASRMESNSLPGRIHCSKATAALLARQACTLYPKPETLHLIRQRLKSSDS